MNFEAIKKKYPDAVRFMIIEDGEQPTDPQQLMWQIYKHENARILVDKTVGNERTLIFSELAATQQGNYIQTHSGTKFYPFDPRQEDISIMDIAHALANICRFTGHTKKFYSVAQHSVLCSENIAPEYALYALLHDGSEAYMGDVARPIKVMPEMAFYRQAENRLQDLIYKAYGLDPDVATKIHSQIKEVDNRILYTEKRDLLAVHVSWPWRVQPFKKVIQPLPPAAAEQAFLNRFMTLIEGIESTVLRKEVQHG